MPYSRPRKWPLLLLILLITIDFILIAFGIRHSLGYIGDPKFGLDVERGYAELYQYAKFFWIAIILTWFGFEKRKTLYFVGAMLFFYFLFDDSLQIHESFGSTIVELFDIPHAFGLRGQDFGELIVSASVGFFFLVTGWMTYQKDDTLAKLIGYYVLLGVLLLTVCGVGFDMLHIFLADGFPWTKIPLAVLEDGGELVAASIISWFVLTAGMQELTSLQIPSLIHSEKINPPNL